MNQAEKRAFLIKRLLDEDRRYRSMEVPVDSYEQKRMLRSLMNVRHPKAIDDEFLTVQDEYLRQELEDTGITRLAEANVVNYSLSNLDALVEVAAEEGYIQPDDIARLIAFRNNPSDESWIGGNK